MESQTEENKACIFTENCSRLTCDMPPHIIGPLQIKILSCHRNILAANLPVFEHEHPYYELSFIISGSMESRCDNSRIASSTSDKRIFLMPPATRHQRVFGPASSNINQTMTLMISGNGPDGPAACQHLSSAVAQHGYSFDSSSALKEVTRLLEQILEQNQADINTSRELIKSFLSIFFVSNFPELFSEKRHTTFAGEFKRDRISAIKNAVEHCLNNKRQLDNCEKLLGRSLRHLNRIFKAETGCSLFQYQTQRKLDIAQAMLSSSQIPIRDIAFSLGFASPEVFTIFFKKHQKLSPSEFRKNATPPC